MCVAFIGPAIKMSSGDKTNARDRHSPKKTVEQDRNRDPRPREPMPRVESEAYNRKIEDFRSEMQAIQDCLLQGRGQISVAHPERERYDGLADEKMATAQYEAERKNVYFHRFTILRYPTDAVLA